tara:strand:- start:48 stop:227 length:180 start_codon:yes stop_codon:yes gene_type:complete
VEFPDVENAVPEYVTAPELETLRLGTEPIPLELYETLLDNVKFGPEFGLMSDHVVPEPL